MPSLLQEFLASNNAKRMSDVRNIGLYIFIFAILAITWSGVKTVQTNYELQKKIATLKQQNQVTQLENSNAALQNQYYTTDQYLDLAARQQLGLAAPGETVWLVPQEVAMKYVDQSLNTPAPTASASSQNSSKLVQNVEAWRDFLFGHKLSSN